MAYRNRDRNDGLLHDLAVGAIGLWIASLFVDAFIGWWERRDSARYRRQYLEASRKPSVAPSRMWWDEGALPPGVTAPRPEPPPRRRSLMWWEEGRERRER